MTTITIKGSPIHLKGKFPEKGQKAPDFLLVDSELKNKKLSDFSGKKLLTIVPSLDTPLCAKSTRHFHETLANKNISLLVISADLPFAQKRYCGIEGISSAITLSMMRDKSFAESYGVLIEEGALAGICTRAILLLDENNTVIYSELVPELTEEPDYQKLTPYL